MSPKQLATELKNDKNIYHAADADVIFKTGLDSLYGRYLALKDVELKGNHRLRVRRTVLELAPKFGIGAEIGVFTGMFSEVLAEITEPKTLYLVDPWAKLHGDLYPNWGAYTAYQCLPTRAAKEAAELRAQNMNVDCVVVEAFAADWLQDFREPFLDWVYLDASHKYHSVLNDLRLVSSRMRPGGVIMGDDCWVKSKKPDQGVAAALNDFLELSAYDIIHLDKHGQWAIKLSNDVSEP